MLDFKIYPWRKELLITENSEDNIDIVIITDSDGLVSQPIQMPSQLWESLQVFNIEDINGKISRGEYRFEIELDQLRNIIYNLDIMGYLESPRFEYIKNENKKFNDSPIRLPVCTGNVYPETKVELEQKINSILNLSKYNGKQKPKIIFAPHLDYGTGINTLKIYAEAFKPIVGHSYSKVVMIGTSHYANTNLIMLCDKDYQTPIGLAKYDRQSTDKLLSHNKAMIDNMAHRNEHSLELHLPFLQQILGTEIRYTFALTGILNHYYSDKNLLPTEDTDFNKLIGCLQEIDDPDTLYVFSGDLTHIGRKFGDETTSLQMRDENEVFLSKIQHYLAESDSSNFYNTILPIDHKFRVCGLSPFYIGLSLNSGLTTINSSDTYIWEEDSTSSSVSIISYVYG